MKKDFLTLFDLEEGDLEQLFQTADMLKTDGSLKPLDGKTAVLIFQKPSLRTRVSFEVATFQLGGHPIFLSQESIGIGVRESPRDVAQLLSRYNDVLIARLFDHDVLEELAQNATIPVVNALTDLSHPCQVLADVYTIRQHGLLRPKLKIVFVGDGNNIVHSWLEFSTLYPIHFVLAVPPKYEPNSQVLERALAVGMSTIEILNNPADAVKDADVVYTDVWASMGQEAEAEVRRRAFRDYQVNERLLSFAKPSCIVMHCLPAHRGEEITSEVLDGPQSIVFDQAENRLHVQKAILTRLLEPSGRGDMANVAVGRTVEGAQS